MADERRDPLEHVEAVPEILARRPRSKPKRDRSWDAQRSKATYDLPPELIERVKEIAGEISAQVGADVPVYDVARLLLEAGIERYEAGALRFETQPKEVRLHRQ